ncbi:MAG: NAD(P)/FAD-dependent oxidoreductase [Tannerella sp.]|jgi:all-trans-retinol 13,14-reductase|nr:NAD(P)/FAD-dependent oxidoreductase [Tannerella sp.]
MEKYDAVIIGSGLGGLQCGYILAKHGMNVCVIEKHSQPGGCMQSFRRGKHVFDTGFHYVGGLDRGQPLHRLFDYFGLLDLPWQRMDENGFDEVVINDRSYMFAGGYERFAETLAEKFPHQRKNLIRYAGFLRDISGNIFDSLLKNDKNVDFYGTSLFGKSAYDYLAATVDDPLLRNVLSGTSLKMELNPKTFPLYIFAQINSSFIQSAWRLKGGGSQIVESLVKSIRSMGGTVRLNAEATRLNEVNGRIETVEINNGEELIQAGYFIANIHPSLAVSMIDESRRIRKIYRKRMNNLANTYGMFTANVALKKNIVPYLNRNIYVFNTDDLWKYADYKPENVNSCAMVSFHVPDDSSGYTTNIDILTPMYWDEVRQWDGTPVGRRGDDYVSYKKNKTEACLNLVSKHVPGLRDTDSAIENIYTSTSLSYRDYTGTPCGSAFGVRKNCDRLLTTLLSPRTPEPNMFLTGQNLNLHGVLGVSMTSFFTCSEIIGSDLAVKGLF